MSGQHRDFRYRDDTGFEARCLYCAEWWPITTEFWSRYQGMRRCKACWRLYRRLYEAGRMASDLFRAAHNQASRARYHANRQKANAAAAAWRATHKEHIAAYNRAYRVRNAERLQVQSHAYYADARPVILAKKRDAYRVRRAAA